MKDRDKEESRKSEGTKKGEKTEQKTTSLLYFNSSKENENINKKIMTTWKPYGSEGARKHPLPLHLLLQRKEQKNE